jgi:hypothetical protein
MLFPTAYVQDEESLMDAAIRALHEHIGGTGGSGKRNEPSRKLPLDLYYPSQAPLGVQLKPYFAGDGDDLRTSPGDSSEEEFYGTKTFFVKAQYDDGMLTKKDIGEHDFAWLDRTEIVDRLRAQGMGDDDTKFYQHLL